jgi:hypothetical protein
MAAPSVDDLARSFERYLRAGNKSPRTIETYLEAVAGFTGFLSATSRRSLDEARREDVEAWIGALLARWKPATAHNRYRGLHAFYRWLEDEVDSASERSLGMASMSLLKSRSKYRCMRARLSCTLRSCSSVAVPVSRSMTCTSNAIVVLLVLRRAWRGDDPGASWRAPIHRYGWQVLQEFCWPGSAMGAGGDDSGPLGRDPRRMQTRRSGPRRHRATPASLQPRDAGTMSEHETTDLFRLYLDEVGRHPLLTKKDGFGGCRRPFIRTDWPGDAGRGGKR